MINPYSSITNNTSQAQILYGLYANSEDFNPINDFVILRYSEYSYRIYYGIDLRGGKSAMYIEYYRTSTNNQYKVRTGTENNFTLNTDTYLSVGTIPNTIQLIDYKTDSVNKMSFITIVLLTIVIIFNGIRSKINVIHRPNK